MKRIIIEKVSLPIEKESIKNISRPILLSMYINMLRIRLTEERVADLVDQKEIICPCHLYTGQEAVAVGVCSALSKNDYVFSTHRSHGHYLAKGGDMKQLMAELYGKATGCSKGRGGSMHLVLPGIGLMGSSAIVGGTIPLAVGAALGFSFRKKKNISVAFFGDGATTEGVLYESLNFASLKRLPVLFVCENNFYCTHMPISKIQSVSNLYKIGKLFGIPSFQIDGNNIIEVYKISKKAIDNVRIGRGPMFIEALTYRWRGHVGPNYDLDKGMRLKKELNFWMKDCPIKKLKSLLLKEKILDIATENRIYKRINIEIEEAIKFARRSLYPAKEELQDVFEK